MTLGVLAKRGAGLLYNHPTLALLPRLAFVAPLRLCVARILPSFSQKYVSSTAIMSHNLYTDETPPSVKNAKGIHLISMSTPNGQKVQIFLEELKDAYGLDFSTTLIHIMTNEQKKDWFLRLDPNGRIPVLVDNTKSPPFTVHETSAELQYLQKSVDKDNKFGFADELEQNQSLQWLFFWHGSGAPYMGQLNHFGKFIKEDIPYAVERFKNETLRVFGVLEIHLSGKYTGEPREYLAGKGKGKYSISDIGTFPWVKGWSFSGRINEKDMEPFPHLLKWIDRIAERPAVQRGIGDKYAPKGKL